MKLRTQDGRRLRGAASAASVVLAAMATASAATALAAGVAGAQGFGLNEIGSCAIARGFATTSAPCEDASVLYWNAGAAASAVTRRGLSLYVGGSGIAVKGSFTADTTGRRYPGDVPTEFPPFLGLTWKGDRLALGLAGYVPYGLTSQWEPDFVGRFSAQKAALQSIYVQPTIAYEVVPGRLSIGGGPTLGWSQLELRQSIDLSQQTAQPGVTFARLGIAPGTEFARARVKGTATGIGFNVGAYAHLTSDLTLGARYLSKTRFKYDDADATFEQVNTGLGIYPGSPLRAQLPAGTPANAIVPLDLVLATQFSGTGLLRPGQKASTQIDFPAQFQVGLGYTGFARTTLSADYALIQWTAFKELPVNFGATSPLTRTLREDYENSHSVRLGAEHRFGGSDARGARDGITGRVGFAYAGTPAPDVTVTPLLPDMNRYNFAGGVGLPLTSALTLDAGYLRVETKGRRGRVVERTTEAQTAAQLNGGWYALSANIFTLSLKASF